MKYSYLTVASFFIIFSTICMEETNNEALIQKLNEKNEQAKKAEELIAKAEQGLKIFEGLIKQAEQFNEEL